MKIVNVSNFEAYHSLNLNLYTRV